MVDMDFLSALPLKQMDSSALAMNIIDRVQDFSPGDVRRVRDAIATASFLHRNQVRGNRGCFEKTPYIEHPLRVALRLIRWGVTDVDILVAGILHDTLEDCETDIIVHLLKLDDTDHSAGERQALAREWMGATFGPKVLDTVIAVTNIDAPAGSSRAQKNAAYIEHVRSSIRDNVAAFLVKFADYMDNGAGLHHNNVPGNESMVRRLAVKYAPLGAIFEHELASNQQIHQFVSLPGFREIQAKIASSQTTLRHLVAA